MNDLFGNPVEEFPIKEIALSTGQKRRKYDRPRGYAAVPGTGPIGQTCGTCRFLHRNAEYSNTHFKCRLLYKQWTKGPGTDIVKKSPACSKWLPASQKDPQRGLVI